MKWCHSLYALLLVSCLCLAYSSAGAEQISSASKNSYVAKNEDLHNFFDAMGPQLKQPIIVSKLAARKQISGNFDFSNPQVLLERLSQQLGLIWYNDGQAIYVYDSSEMHNAVISLRSTSLSTFNDFLHKSGLYDKRYALRGDDHTGTVYVSGPPVFVDLVVNAANLIDKGHNDSTELGLQKISIVRLNNTFVDDRIYTLRDQKIVIPGIATVIDKLLKDEESPLQSPTADVSASVSHPPVDRSDIPSMPDFSRNAEASTIPAYTKSLASGALQTREPASDIKVIAYPDTNSLLIKGTAEQVRFIEQLTAALDVSKRHIELSLWIIDLSREDLEQLGGTWSGGITIGNSFGVTLNQAGSITTLNGGKFLASIKALEQKNKATVVSRPVVLTQENVPALFDNNRTFYAELIGERNSSLEHVTYGTLVSVLPRFSADGQIEMSLNIEDGSETKSPNSEGESSGSLPEVGRTHISTVARVPQGKSLLIGGYTRDASTEEKSKVPFLGELPLIGGLFRYSSESKSNTVRVFLIQPREITEPLPQDADDFTAALAEKGGLELGDLSLQKWVRSYLARNKRGFDYGN